MHALIYTITIRLLLIFASLTSLMATDSIPIIQPLPNQEIPRDHEVRITAVVPLDQTTVDTNYTITATATIDGGAPIALGFWTSAGTDQNGDVTIINISGEFPSAQHDDIISVTVEVDTPGGDIEYSGSINWIAKDPSQISQPLLPFILEPLTGTDEAETLAVRRIDSSVVMAAGQSIYHKDLPDEAGRATLWRFNGSAVETPINVHAELTAFRAFLDLSTVEGSQVSCLNHLGESAGIVMGTSNLAIDGTGKAIVAWFREANGTIHKLADLSVGQNLDDAFLADSLPEVTAMADDGWVVMVRNNNGTISNVTWAGEVMDLPNMQALACRWNGVSVSTVDLHAEIIGAGAADILTWVNGVRSGTAGNLGQVWASYFTTDIDHSLRPCARTPSGAAGVYALSSTTAYDFDSDISWMNAAATRAVMGIFGDNETLKTLQWTNGATSNETAFPPFFADTANTNEFYIDDFVDDGSSAHFIVGSAAFDGAWRHWVQPYDSTTNGFAAQIFPEWQIRNSYLRDEFSTYLNITVFNLDYDADERVYAGEGWGWANKVTVLLVNEALVIDPTDVVIAYPEDGSTIPVGHQVPVIARIEGLSGAKTIQQFELVYEVIGSDDPEQNLSSTTLAEDLEMGLVIGESIVLDYSIGTQLHFVARITYADDSVYEEESTITVGAAVNDYHAIALPWPAGTDPSDSETNGILFDNDVVYVTGNPIISGESQALYWTWEKTQAPVAHIIPAIPDGVVPGEVVFPPSGDGQWTTSIGLVNSEVTMIVLQGEVDGEADGLQDIYAVAYQPNAVSKWHVIGKIVDNGDLVNGDPGDFAVTLLGDGNVHSGFSQGSGFVPAVTYTTSAVLFELSAGPTWTPTLISMPGGAVNSAPTTSYSMAGENAGVGVFTRIDDLDYLYYLPAGTSAASEITALQPHPTEPTAEAYGAVATVGGQPLIYYGRYIEINGADSARSFMRTGVAGADIELQGYSAATDYIDVYSANSDADIGGEVALFGDSYSRMTLWNGAGQATDLNWSINADLLKAMGLGSYQALVMEEVYAMTPRVSGLPIITGEAAYESYADAQTHEVPVLLVPMAYINSANIAPTLTQISNITLPANASISFDVLAFDPDGDTLTYSADNESGGTVSILGQTVTFTAGPSAGPGSFDVTVSDGDLTDTKSALVDIYAPSGLIINDFSLSDSVLEEGDSTNLYIQLDGPAPAPGVQVVLDLSGSIAERGTDFKLRVDDNVLPLNGNLVTITIPEGSTSLTVEIEIIDDNEPEVEESIEFALYSVDGSTNSLPAPETLIIGRSDYQYFVLWLSRNRVNGVQADGESYRMNWWMDTEPGKIIESAVFHFPAGSSKVDINGIVGSDGLQVVADAAIFDGIDNVSLSDLQAAAVDGDYSVTINYTDTSSEIRTENGVTFDYVSGWPDYPVITAPLHGSSNIAGNTVTATWTGDSLGWISIVPFNGPTANNSREYFESEWLAGLPSNSFEIPVQLMANQSYEVEFNREIGNMGSITCVGFSTAALPAFDATSDNLLSTPFGVIPDGNYPMRYKAENDSITSYTRTVSRETIKLPGTATDVDTVKIHEARVGHSTTFWWAKGTDGGLYVIQYAENDVKNPPAVPYLLIPAGVSPSSTWYSGDSDVLTTYVADSVMAPNGGRTGCTYLSTFDGNGTYQEFYIIDGLGLVEWYMDPNQGFYYHPLIVSDPPVIAATVLQNATEDAGSISIALSATDLDTDVSLLNWSITSGPGKGGAVFLGGVDTGGSVTITYTPSANQFGSDSIIVTVTDPDLNTDSETINIAIAGINDAPSFTSGANVVVNEDSGAYSAIWATNVSPGPFELETPIFTITNNSAPSIFGSQPSVASDGTLSFTPADDANGLATIDVELSDGLLSTSTVQFTITVTAVNDAPTFTLAGDQVIDEDVGVQTVPNFLTGLDKGAADESGQTLIGPSLLPANPLLFSVLPAVDGSGQLTYTAVDNANGSTLVNVTVNDDGGIANGGSNINIQQFTITINAVNDAPVNTVIPDVTGAQAETEIQTATTGIWNDDLDQLSPVFSYTYQWQNADDNSGTNTQDINLATNPTYALQASDAWVRVAVIATDDGLPAPGIAGTVAYSDWRRGVNALPIIVDSIGTDLAILEDAVVAVTRDLTATDLETNDSELVWTVQADGIKGEATIIGSPATTVTISYLPVADAFGTDTVTIACDDGEGGISTHVITVQITAINDAPSFTLVGDQNVLEDAATVSVSSFLTNLSANPIDDLAQTVAVTAVNNDNNPLFQTQPAIDVNGDLTYTLAANANGVAIVTVIAQDNGGTTNGGIDSYQQNFTITVTAVNDAPTFTIAGDQVIDEDAGVQTVPNFLTGLDKGAADESGQTLTGPSLIPANPLLFLVLPAVDGSGQLTYTAANNANGSTLVDVNVNDDGGTANGGVDINVQQFTITINAVNDAPVNTVIPSVSGLQVESAVQTATTGTWNDDLDQLSPTLSYTYQWQNADDNSGTNTQNINLETNPTYALQASDAWIRVAVIATDDGLPAPGIAGTVAYSDWRRGVNALPVIVDSIGTDLVILEDAVVAVTRDLTATDLETIDSELVWTVQTDGIKGEATIIGSPATTVTISYLPVADAFGTDTVTIACDDGEGGISTHVITVQITGINDAPTFVLSSTDDLVLEDAAARTITNLVTTQVAGPSESDTLSLGLGTISNPSLFSTGPAIAANGTLTYTLAANAFGSSTIDIMLSDDGGTANSGVDSSTQTFTVNVTAVNDAPTFNLGANQVVLEDVTTVTVAGFLTNIDPNVVDVGQNATLQSVANDNNSLFSVQPAIDGSGELTFTPAADANGVAIVTVTVQDDGGTANGGVNITQDTFTIEITAVNDVPSFTIGADQAVNVDAGAVTVVSWISTFSSGPSDESGQTVSFTATAGNPALFDVQPAIAANGTLTFTPKPGQSGSTSVAVSVQDNGGTANGGFDTSADQNFLITLQQGPAITQHPSNNLVLDGQTVLVSVTATGLPTPSYQWQKKELVDVNFSDIGSATSSSYTSPVLSIAETGIQYRCLVSNPVGTVTSNPASMTVGTAPVIVDPSNQIVAAGSAATFTVSVSGSPAPSLQWERDNSGFEVIPGATGLTYTISPTTLGQTETVRCVATNVFGNDTSASATLTVNALPPQISQQPQSQVVLEGQNANFSVIASGNPAPTYQWQRNAKGVSSFVDMGGETNSTLSMSAVTELTNSGDLVHCVVSNSGGDVTSSDATLTVTVTPSAPVISDPISNQAISEDAGDLASMTITASGVPSLLNYQWSRNGAVITGANAAAYEFETSLADDGAVFTCLVSNSEGSVVSPSFTLTVNSVDPTVSADESGSVVAGTQVNYSVNYVAGPAPSFQWKMNAISIPGATAVNYQRVMSIADANLPVTCDVSYNGGAPLSSSNAISIDVTGTAPVFSVDPADLAAPVGGIASFTVTVSGSPTPVLQWQTASEITFASPSVIAGATGTSVALTVSSEIYVRCVATNALGSVNSLPAHLTLASNPPVITSHPINVSIADAALANFSVTATGSTLTYQWQRRYAGQQSFANITDAIAATLPIVADLNSNQGASYRCVVSSGGSSVASNAAQLSISGQAPVFIVQPSSVSVDVGKVASFVCEAQGGSVTYQWKRNGVDIIGATTRFLNVVTTANDNGVTYTCVATNITGPTVSTGALLSVLTTAPSFTLQPVNKIVAVGGSTTLSVAVSGKPAPSVQWQSSTDGATFSAIGGATAVNYNPVSSVAGVTYYRVIASNAAGSVASNIVTVTVNAVAPYIVQQPSNQTCMDGFSASMQVLASGTGPLTYQWKRNANGAGSFVDIGGANAATYTIPTATVITNNDDQYICLISNSAGSVSTIPLTLTVAVIQVVPAFTLQANAASVVHGEPVQFVIAATGVPTPTLQWRKNGVAISNETFAELNFTADIADNAASYTCVATSTAGSATSVAAVLTVTSLPPSISTEPIAVNVNAGKAFNLSVVASGAPTPTYQWKKNGIDVTGATAATYSVNRGTLNHNGSYTCAVSNAGGTVTSQSAQVTVKLGTLAITTELFDLSSSPALRIQPTPRHYGLAAGELLRYESPSYVPVGPDEPLVIGSCYFLDNGATAVLQDGYAPAPLVDPAPVTLVEATWNAIAVTVGGMVDIGAGPVSLLTLADDPDYVIWYSDSTTGELKRLVNPSNYIGGVSVVVPVGALIWIIPATLPGPLGAA